MASTTDFDIFLATAPGLEEALRAEVQGKGFKRVLAVPGGVTVRGGWPDVWRANLWLRGVNKVIARIGRFRAERLDALEARAQQIRFADVLGANRPFRVEASCSRSRIYHSGAAAERVARAITARTGATHDEAAAVTVMVRIEDDVCTIGVDTSGELLHKRGTKEQVGRAPLRETMAALFLLQCGFDGREPVLDPMCGSGTFVIEAAEIAAGLNPGRGRAFAFEQLATFDAAAWQRLKARSATVKSAHRCYGYDRDSAAIAMSLANAVRAGVDGTTTFVQQPVSALAPPAGPPGLVIVNPPYGGRLGDKDKLAPLYHALGETLRARFSGWRVGLVTAEKSLAHVSALPFLSPGPPVANGGIRISLFRTSALP
jgi:putative N6-adenine-specific DNA methylase